MGIVQNKYTKLYIRSLNPLGFPWNFVLQAFVKIYHICLRPDTNKGPYMN
jgi:hypothetical protein